MNKIYRVVFNHATQSWTAVAEIARAQGKGSRSIVGSIDNQNGVTGKLLRFSLIMSGIILSSQSFAATGADVTIDGNSHYCFYDQGSNSILCGDKNTKNSLTTVIPGFGAITQGGSNTVTMGTAATTLGNNAVAVGNASTANGVNSIAVGRNSEALNNDDVAIGTLAGAGRGDKGSDFTAGTAFAAGTVYAGGATQNVASIGTNSGISIGQNSGTNSTGVNNTMIGKSAGTQLFGDNTVSIGTNANNYLANGFSNGQVNTNNNTVDALSGNTKAANAVNRSRKSVAIGNNAMTYDDSNIAIGDGAKSLGANSLAMGTGARAGMAYATVGGVARGDKGSIAIGNGAYAPLEGDLSIGVSTGSRVNQNSIKPNNMQTTKNISVGYEAGGNVYGYKNSVFGISSGSNIGTATATNYSNVAIGDQVGNNIRGDNNVNIGYQGGGNITSNSNTSIGSRSGSHISGANNVTTGTFSGTFVSGNDNWAAGVESGTHLGVLSNASGLNVNDNQFYAGSTQLVKRGASANVAAGKNAGQYINGSKNIAFGQNAGQYVGHKGTTFGAVSNNNIAMGEKVGQYIEGSNNFAAGLEAGRGTGTDATLVRNNSISQGVRATAYTNDSIAIGTDAIAGVQSANGAGKVNAIAIGKGAQATGNQSISVGTGNVVIGDNSGAFGDPTIISGTGSYSVGNNNTISTNDTFVVGSNVTKTLDNSVFLGKEAAYTAKGTSTDGVEKVSDATVGGITYAGTSFAGQTPVGVVSVGAKGAERRIQNVAAGLINATSTDAINGSQLYAVASTLGEQVENTYFHVNTGKNANTGNATTNLGKITDAAGATGTNAVTAGKNATAAGKDAVAVGESATANATQVTSVGHNAGLKSTNAANSTFIGTGAGANSNGTAQGTQLTTAYNTYVGSNAGNRATGVQNTAVGGNNAGAGVTGDANAAFGHASLYNTKGNLNTGLGAYAGQNSTGNSNTSVGDNAGRKVTGNNNTALGSNAGTGVTGSNNVAIGLNAGQTITASDTVSIGNGAKATEDKSVALGSGATTAAAVGTTNATVNGISYGDFAGTAPIATVSVGSAGNERTITNVAAGRISATSTDAINGSQLYMVADKLSTDIQSIDTSTYFHVNTGTNTGGNATTNLGKITEAAGAKYAGAITAGLNTTAISEHSISIGQDARAGAEDNFSNWANLTNPATGAKFTSEQELKDYFAANQDNNNQVYRAVVGKRSDIAIGHGAIAEGGRNISIGEFAGVGTADNWNIYNVNIGSEAGQNSKKDYSVAIGYRAGALTEAQQLTQEATLDNDRHPSILIGKQAGEGTVAYGTVAMGAEAGKDISDVSSVHNIAIGRNAGQGVKSNDGINATFKGFGAGANTLMGASAGRNLSGDGNVAIGNLSGSGTTGDNNFFGGHLAGANGSSDRSIIIGSHAGTKITSDRSVFIGNYAHSEKKGNVVSGIAIGNSTLAGKNTDGSTTYNSIAIGNSAAATNDNTIALGMSASASGLRSTAIGSGASSSGEQAIAIGRGAVASGAQSISIGTQNRVTADNAGAIGDPSIVSGAGSYTLGNDNAVGSTSSNVGAFGNNNQIGATATYDAAGKLILANGLTDTAAVENSRAVGNENYINTSDTYVLGSGVGTKDDGTVLGTVKNSVYLGNDSTVAKGAAVGTKNLTKEGAEGATTTAGDTGEVTSATVSGVTYGSFAGKTAAGAVSVGSAGLERRVMNVAAGEISATSTDAINGSQLYMVAQGTLDQMPVIYTDTNGNKLIKSPDGNFYPAGTVLDATGKPVDTTIQPVTNVIASMNDGDNIANTPKTLANVAGSLTPTYNKGDMTIVDGKPTNTAAGGPTISQTGPKAEDAAKIYNNAATVGDVLNAGWNLQGNGSAQDFVKPYDTVNFADGTNTTVDVSTEDGKVSTIKVNVDAQSTVESAQTPVVYTNKDGDKLIKGDDGKFYPADSVKIGDNYYPAGTTTDANGNPVDANGDTVTALTPTETGDIIASMNNGDNSTTTAPMTLTNIASNLPNTYNKDAYNTADAPVTTSQALPDNLNVNNAATVGDILNAGWNLQGNGVAKDFVKPYDTVNFVNGNATTATVETAADGKSSTVKYDVQVDGNTIKVVDGKLTAAADSNTVTGVTAGDNITVTSTTDASGNPTYTVATKKDVTFDSVTINNGPTINADGINMNGDKITNVADGDISPTSKDAVNGSQLYSAVNNINSNIAASKEEVTSNDKSVTVTTTKNASGSNVFDLSVNTDGTTITKNADGALTVNTTPLTNNIDGSVNTPAAPNAIATAGDVANAINNSGFTLTAQGSNGSLVKPGSTVDMNNTDGNIVISKSASDNKVTYNLAKDIKVDSVTTGNTVVNNSGVTINNADPAKTVSLTENGLNNGGNRITNVAPGKDGTDAVNVNQLNQVNNNVVNLNNKVNRVDRDLRGGIAGANAAAALPQAYIPGKSMVAAAAGTYRGQSALAVGYSRISDNGKIILKLQGNTNTRGDIGGAIGVGYQW